MRQAAKLLIFFMLLSGVMHAQTRTLDFFIDQAKTNSPVIKDYTAQLQSAGLDSSLLDASRKPQVDAIGMVMVAPTYHNYGYDGAVTNGGNYEAIASVTQPIFAKKLYAPQYEEIRIGKESIANSSAISAHDISKDVIDQFITAYSSFREYSYNSSVLKLLRDEEGLLTDLTSHGIYLQTDLLSFELELKTQQVAANQSYFNYRNELGQLNILCGISDTAYYELSAPSIEKTAPMQKVSPFIFQFAIDSFRLVNQRAMLDVRYRPHFNWFADAGLISSSPATIYRNFGLSFGISFIMPLYDGHQRNIQYQKIGINENIRMNYRNYFVGQQSMRVLQLQTQIDRQKKLVQQQQELLNISQQLINADKVLLEKGQLSVTNYIVAIKNHIDIQAQLNRAEVDELILVNQLNYWNW